MKAYLVLFILFIAILGVILLSIISRNSTSFLFWNTPKSTPYFVIQGVITDIADAATSLSIQTSSGNQTTVNLQKETTVTNTAGDTFTRQDLHRGFTIRLQAIRDTRQALSTKQIVIIKQPSIILYVPNSDSTINNQFTIEGIARAFENSISLRITNERTGKILLSGILEVKSPDMGVYGPFEESITLSNRDLKKGDPITITLFEPSAKDGSESNTISYSVRYDNVNHMQIKLFLPNDNLNTQRNCETVFPVQRDIISTTAVARIALETLFQGPTDGEVIEGYGTAIPDNLSLSSIILTDKIAVVTLSPNLNSINNECRLKAIKAQISATLKQFPSISQVDFK